MNSTTTEAKILRLFGPGCIYTDDSVMTIAVAKALRLSDKDFLDLSALAIKCMQEYGRAYPYCGYGGSFSTGYSPKTPSLTAVTATEPQ